MPHVVLQTAALSDPSSHFHLFILPVHPNRVKYKAHWTSMTRSLKGKKIKELAILVSSPISYHYSHQFFISFSNYIIETKYPPLATFSYSMTPPNISKY